MADVELLLLQSNSLNYLTVGKQMSSGLFKMLATKYSLTNHISNKKDLVLWRSIV